MADIREKKKTVFLFLCTRIYLSDVLHTPYIQELAARCDVVVFLPRAAGAKFSTDTYPKIAGVTYAHLPEPAGRFLTLFDVLLRNEFIRRYDGTTAIDWRTRRGHRGDWRRRFLRRVSNLFPKNFFSTEFFSFVERMFMPNFNLFKQYAVRYDPAIVMVSTPGIIPFDAYAIACAKRLGIPTVAFNFSWDNLTSLSRHVRKTDYLICWNNFHRTKAKELFGYGDDHLCVAGTMRFDPYFRKLPGETSREEFLRRAGLDPARKTVLFAPRSFGTYSQELIRSFIRWQKENSFGEQLNFFIRVHPLDSVDGYKEFIGITNVHIDSGGTMTGGDASKKAQIEITEGDWAHKKNTIMHTDVCINVASTFSVEAFIFNKPVINLGFFGEFSDILTFPHYAPIVERGAVRVAMSADEVKKHLNHYLENADSDAEARRAIVELFVTPTDGYSYKRNVAYIGEILHRTNTKRT